MSAGRSDSAEAIECRRCSAKIKADAFEALCAECFAAVVCERCSSWIDDAAQRARSRICTRCIGCNGPDLVADAVRAARVQLESSPHRCRCGAHVLVAEASCRSCTLKSEADESTRARAESARERPCPWAPKRWWWSSFDSPHLASRVRDRGAVSKAQAAASDPVVDRIVFTGPPGAGKTSLAVACAHRMSGRWSGGSRPHYAQARRLSLARSQAPLGAEAAAVREAVDADILLVDDLGLDDSEHRDRVLLDVLYERFAEADERMVQGGKITIVTLAIEPSDVARYGGGVARRLLDPDPGNRLVSCRWLGVVQGGAK